MDLEDAVVAVKDEKGKVKSHQAFNLTAAGAIAGGFWGPLIGLIFLSPLLGMALGAAAGAASGALTDVGLSHDDEAKLQAALSGIERGSTIGLYCNQAKIRFCVPGPEFSILLEGVAGYCEKQARCLFYFKRGVRPRGVDEHCDILNAERGTRNSEPGT